MYIYKNKKAGFSIFTFVLLALTYSLSSCHSAKNVAYFQNITDSVGVETRMKLAKYQELVIQKGDILDIDISTIDSRKGGEVSTESVSGSGSEGQTATGYMVDKNGNVEMPLVGKLKLEGLTIMEAKEHIRETMLKYYKDPLVNVRMLNFIVSVFGEVGSPGRYAIANEKVTILDAIALAGDLTLGAKRSNVMLIRELDGETIFTRVDLNRTDLFQSDYYYLQSGDKIYVEPLRAVARTGTSDRSIDRVISLTLSVVSVSIAIVSVMSRFNN